MRCYLLYTCVLVIISTVPGDKSVEISQFPKHLTANRGTNITFYCSYPFSLHSLRIHVYWWKEGESVYLHTEEDSRKQFGIKTKGSGFFQLLDVNIQDAGVYYCAVRSLGEKAGNGNGSRLTVYVPPTPLTISRRFPETNQSVFLTLVCETAEFYPEDLNFTWFRNGTEMTTVTNTVKQQNLGKLFKAYSYMKTQRVQNGDVYTCSVSHISLQNPEIANYTVQPPDKGNGSSNNYLLIVKYAVGACVSSVILIMFVIGCRRIKRKGSNRLDCPGELTVMEADSERMAYATLDLNSSKKVPKPRHQEERTVYAQTKQGTPSNNVTYAALDMSGSKETGKINRNENTEYAEVHAEKLQRSSRSHL